MKYSDLGRLAKNKQPDKLSSYSDEEAGRLVAGMYPQYGKMVTEEETIESPSFETPSYSAYEAPDVSYEAPVYETKQSPFVPQQTTIPGKTETLSATTDPEQAIRSQPPKSWMDKAKDFAVENLPVIGSVAGSVLGGVAAGGFGAIPAAGAGSLLGETLKRKIKGEEVTPESLKTAAGSGIAGEVIGMGAGQVVKGVVSSIAKNAAKTFGKFNASQALKVVQEHGKDIINLIEKYVPRNAGYDEVLGSIEKRGRGGVFDDILRQSEDAIQSVAKTVKDKIPVDEILDSLKSQRDLLATQIGNAKKLAQIDKIILEAQKRYKKGISVSEALKILRAGNEAFGKNVVDVDVADAVTTAAQKLETNAIRNILKTRFPAIADALETQSDILTLRPILEKARSVVANETVGDIASKVDLSKPWTWMEGIRAGKKLIGLPETPGRIPSVIQSTVPEIARRSTQPIAQSVAQTIMEPGIPATPQETIPEYQSVTREAQVPVSQEEDYLTEYERKLGILDDWYSEKAQQYTTKDQRKALDDEYKRVKSQLDEERSIGKERQAIEKDKPKSETSSQVLDVVDNLLSRDTKPITGLNQIESYIPGTSAKYTASLYDQLKNMLSLENRQKLKGQGQISDFEARMLEKASTALNRSLSDEDFRRVLQDLKNDLSKEQSGLPQQPEALTGQKKNMEQSGTLPREMSILPARANITQKFGQKSRYDVFSKGVNYGVDFSVPSGTPVSLPSGRYKVIETYAKSPNKGRIGNATNRGYGNSILVEDMETGEKLRFSHLSKVHVKPGEIINGGKIAQSGTSGNASGAHLDIEYYTPSGKIADVMRSRYGKLLFPQEIAMK